MTIFIPDVSNNNWGSTTLTASGQQKQMTFLSSLSGSFSSFAGLEHKMSQGAGYVDPYGAIAQNWAAKNKFPFIGYHWATTDYPVEQVANWHNAGGGNNVMIDFEDVDDNQQPTLNATQFWDLVDEFNNMGVNVALAYLPEWYANNIGMDLTPLSRNGISLINSAYPLGYSVGSPQDIYRGCGGDAGEGWASYRGGLPSLWQFTSSATLGIFQQVDINAYHGTAQQLGSLFSGIG